MQSSRLQICHFRILPASPDTSEGKTTLQTRQAFQHFLQGKLRHFYLLGADLAFMVLKPWNMLDKMHWVKRWRHNRHIQLSRCAFLSGSILATQKQRHCVPSLPAHLPVACLPWQLGSTPLLPFSYLAFQFSSEKWALRGPNIFHLTWLSDSSFSPIPPNLLMDEASKLYLLSNSPSKSLL